MYEDLLKDKKYDFLKDIKVGYLTIAGSISYGTNIEGSDIDLRGFFHEGINSYLKIGNLKEEIENKDLDIVVYTLKKYVKLLVQCNPNTIETIGTKKEHILIMDEVGKMLRDNVSLFLSKKAYISFAGYAEAQLRRLENALARDSYPQPEKEKHIMKSIEAQLLNGEEEYKNFNKINEVSFDIRDSEKEEYEKEIYISMNVKDMPLRDFLRINSGMSNMLRNYGKLNKRNHKKDVPHLNKHAMHLIRLYYMALDILKNHEVVTYREKEHDFLMAIRNGEVSYDEIFRKQKELKKEVDKAYEESTLPENVDINKINDLLLKMYNK